MRRRGETRGRWRPLSALALTALLGLMPSGACVRAGFDPGAATDGGPDAADAASGAEGGVASDGGADTAAHPDAGAVTWSTGKVTFSETFGGAFNDQGYDVVVDGSGRIIVVGTFQGVVKFGNLTLNSGTDTDGFLVVLSPDGAPKWARLFGGPAGSGRAQGVAVDDKGNVYVCGHYSGTVDFGGKQHTAPSTFSDLFVASYSATGVLRWVKWAGGSDYDFAYDVAVAPGGDLLLTGYYNGAVVFDSVPLPVKGDNEALLARLDTNGNVKWAKGYGSSGSDTGYGVAADASGAIVIGGRAAGPIDLGNGPVGGAGGGSFVAKLSADAKTVTWAKSYANTTLWDLDVHRKSGRIVVAARLSTGADLGQGAITTQGKDDALALGLDASGATAWYDTFGGAESDLGLGATFDGGGNGYVIGLGGPAIDFGQGTVTGSGKQDVFVVSYDPAGALRWAKLFGGAEQDRGYGVAAAPSGAVFVTGRFHGTTDFGGGAGSKTSAGQDIFLVKYD